MREPRTILRWLGALAMLQSTLIFLVHLVLTERLSTVSSGLTDALYKSQAASDQVDNVNQAFSSISSLALWVFVVGIAATSVGYGLLRRIIIKRWPKSSP
jgi:hypothetical protein